MQSVAPPLLLLQVTAQMNGSCVGIGLIFTTWIPFLLDINGIVREDFVRIVVHAVRSEILQSFLDNLFQTSRSTPIKKEHFLHHVVDGWSAYRIVIFMHFDLLSICAYTARTEFSHFYQIRAISLCVDRFMYRHLNMQFTMLKSILPSDCAIWISLDHHQLFPE